MGIIQSDLINEMEQAYIDYSMSVITERAIPNAEDGMKPVQTRFMWSMSESGITSDKPHKKCARIVGDVMGKYHPHGDSSIYEALVRFSQPWSMRYPLVDFHGNNGSIDGDGAAAMRYTECRLSKLGEEALADIKKDVVDFRKNFSEDEDEPIYLSGRFPNLLANGTSGIAVGMACSFAPHNLKEIIKAIVKVIRNSEITIEELMEDIQGPDFPTGGILINKNELIEAYKTGKGRARVRGKYEIEKNKIVFTEIPYGVGKCKLIEDLATAINEKKIDGISDIRDESDRRGMRIVFDLRKDANADIIANQLFKISRLEETYSINQMALINKQPRLINLKQMIEIYIQHQESVLTRRTQFELRKVNNRLEIINGLLIALEDIDNVIELIKKSSSTADARVNLEKKYNLTENQSKAIVDLKLGKLARMEKIDIETEKTELEKEKDRLNNILSNKIALHEMLISELEAISKKYGDERRTQITQVTVTKETKEIEHVKPEDVVVVITKSGEVKKIPSKSFRVQNKNGKGIKNQGEITMDIIKTNTIDTLIIFSNMGKMYRLLVDQVPTGTNSSRGVSIKTLVNMELNEDPVTITSLYRKTDANAVVFITKKGIIKKTSLEEYSKTKRNGIIALTLKEGDSIANITFLKDEQLILVTENGMSIRFNTVDLPVLSRTAIGVKAMSLAENDNIIAGLPIHKETDELAIFTEGGLGRKTKLNEFPIQNRGGKGTIAYKPTVASGPVRAAILLENKDNVLIVGDNTSICISAEDIPSLGKGTIGNLLVKNNKILLASKI